MELSQEFLIDMAINGLGYLLAGIISVVLYSFAKKRKTEVLPELVKDEVVETQQKEINVTAETNNERKVEFITFGSPQQKQNIVEQAKISNEKPQEIKNGRMNRKEAINIAKKMLMAGATHEKIKKILPVSESELALLSLNNK